MPEPENTSRVRLDIPNDRKEELRVQAAMSGMSMAQYCQSLVLEGLDKKRVLKPKKKEK